MLSVLSSVKNLLSNKKLILFYYLLNLLGSLLWAVPVYKTISNKIGHTESLDYLFRDFNSYILGDLFFQLSELLKPHGISLLIVFAVYIFLYIFFSGGVIYAIKEREFNLKRFFLNSSKYWRQNLLLAFICFLVISIGGLLTYLSIEGIKSNIATPDHRQQFYTYFFPLALFLILLMFTQVFWDYARILTVKNNFKPGLKQALKTIFTHYYPLVTLFAILILIIIGALIYKNWLLRYSILLVLFQQAYIIYRVFLKLLYLQLGSDYIHNKNI